MYCVNLSESRSSWYSHCLNTVHANPGLLVCFTPHPLNGPSVFLAIYIPSSYFLTPLYLWSLSSCWNLSSPLRSSVLRQAFLYNPFKINQIPFHLYSVLHLHIPWFSLLLFFLCYTWLLTSGGLHQIKSRRTWGVWLPSLCLVLQRIFDGKWGGISLNELWDWFLLLLPF